METTTRAFVDIAERTNFDALPASAIHSAKRSIVDSIGCALGAYGEAPIRALRAIAARMGSTESATIFGDRSRTSMEWAALVNGSMIRYLDFSDDHFGGSGDTGPHPSDNLGGILSAAQALGRNGKQAIEATVIAYEGCGQLTDLTAMIGGGWDYAVYHSVGTSLGVSKLMGLSSAQIANAISLAVVTNITLAETRFGQLSNWKSMAGPNGSRVGVSAAILAREGITGPPMPFEGRTGFIRQLDSPFEITEIGGDGATPYKIDRTFLKTLPLRYAMQLPVAIAFEVRNRVRVDEIENVRVFMEYRRFTTVRRADYPDPWDPQTRESADHSAPFLIGIALLDGAFTEATFTPERFRDPAVLEFLKKIELREDAEYTKAFPGTYRCRFEVTLGSGEVVTVYQENPRGHPDNPMSDGEIEEKFLRLATSVLPETGARQLLDQLWALEELEDLDEILSLMVVEPGA